MEGRGPEEVVVVEGLVDGDGEVDRVAFFYVDAVEGEGGFAVVEADRRELALAGRIDEGGDAVAFGVGVGDGAGEGDGAVDRGDPAADGGVLEVVAGVAAFGGELDPAELGVGPARA